MADPKKPDPPKSAATPTPSPAVLKSGPQDTLAAAVGTDTLPAGGAPPEQFPTITTESEGRPEPLPATGADGEKELIQKTAQRSAGTGVYRVTGNISSGHVPGQIVAGCDLGPNAEIPWLIAKGALEPIEGLKADPRATKALKEHPEFADEIESLHDDLSEERDRRMAAEKELADLKAKMSAKT